MSTQLRDTQVNVIISIYTVIIVIVFTIKVGIAIINYIVINICFAIMTTLSLFLYSPVS